MQDLSSYLTPISVSLEQLLLDPNNPRFSELGEELKTVPESRFHEAKVQQGALGKMLTPVFEVPELRDTILAVGYLPMDRMVVKKLPIIEDQPQYFYVVEGNRRLAALRLIRSLHDEGKVSLDEVWFAKFSAMEVLELAASAPSSATLVLPGLRHVSGIKEWGPYQKAKAVHKLRESGLSPAEAAQSLGLSTRAANMAYRCFLALEQMKADEEYGEHAEPRMYSYFEETFKRPVVKDWLSWNDEAKQFQARSRLSEFYSWIIPHAVDGEVEPPRLPEAKSIRDLGPIIEDDGALAIFRASEGSLVRALAKHELLQAKYDWEPQVMGARDALRKLPAEELRKLSEQQISVIQDLKSAISQMETDRAALLTSIEPHS